MARREITKYYDDLDDTELSESELRIVRFGFDGKDYVIDLSEENANKFREVMDPYITKGREQYGRRLNKPGAGSDHGYARRIRQWANENGLSVAKRGKIPAEIIEKYREANNL
ncbi:histone-like nucleoid-structuring protein Lsr2 [Corynebacterium spheniscorum]|uniref:Lsr2 protein n=1 Tax=Corynebacterium spheniscorum TaxID=185761 RepID=A0A1I2UPL0_9CORY|nr:Lsr2 family protein [Corynebacterium spheniscorum]KAA8719933.1 Lsr2 family protein [Corynebacterium spheniscorum]SFG79003.1 Lsr2 protein [Corynebacterium spheniscorum]